MYNNRIFLSTELINNIIYNIVKGRNSRELKEDNHKQIWTLTITANLKNTFGFKYNNESIEKVFKINIYEDGNYYIIERVLNSNHSTKLKTLINKNISPKYNYILGCEEDENGEDYIYFRPISYIY